MTMNAKQYVPLSRDELADIRAAASDHKTGAGLFSRALLMHALETLTPDELTKIVEAEKVTSKQRLADGARVANRHRWPDKKESGND